MNYPENEPFGTWSPEQQRKFKIDVLVDGKKALFRKAEGNWLASTLISFHPNSFYRLAPEPETDDSIDWSHVHPRYVKLVCNGIDGAVIVDAGGGSWEWAKVFASYRRGNKPSRTTYRPGFEPK